MRHLLKFMVKPLVLSVFLCSVSCCFAQRDSLEIREVHFNSGEVSLRGRLFVPVGDGRHPAAVILHGGSSNAAAHRSTSTYIAEGFVSKGIAALVYDKRGTGDSGGEVSKSTFDDYINDAISAVGFLRRQGDIDPGRIGLIGPSQGGRIAPLAAARSPNVAFVVSIAGPLASIAEVCLYSSMGFLKSNGMTDSLRNIVDHLWREHYALVERGDTTGLKKLDVKIEEYYSEVDTLFLPLKSDRLDSLGDFQPMYNSMNRDYISDLSKVEVPWLSIYAEKDEATPVDASIKVLREQMAINGRTDYEIVVIPNVDHAYRDVDTGVFFPFDEVAAEWVVEKLNIECNEN
jgi:pimeloyl-ACP methyl ester carboxylesterase